jgi:hypothetical protein
MSTATKKDGPLIEQPGLYYNLPAEDYHADPCPVPSLSSGIVRTICAQSVEHAYLAHRRLGGKGKDPTPEMDLGNVVHALLAGGDDGFEIGTYPTFQSKAAQEWRDAIRAGGRVPVLEKTFDRAKCIADSLRRRAAVGVTNSPFELGNPEVSCVWQTGPTWFRARFDRLILDEHSYADIWDWKTTADISPEKITRSVIDQGYHIQAALYMRGLQAVAPRFAGRISFIFAFVETLPPYAVKTVTLSEGFMHLANVQIGRAVAQWEAAMQSGVWMEENSNLSLSPPSWFEMRIMEEMS